MKRKYYLYFRLEAYSFYFSLYKGKGEQSMYEIGTPVFETVNIIEGNHAIGNSFSGD